MGQAHRGVPKVRRPPSSRGSKKVVGCIGGLFAIDVVLKRLLKTAEKWLEKSYTQLNAGNWKEAAYALLDRN